MIQPFNISKANLSYFCRQCRNKVRGIPITEGIFRTSEFDQEKWLIVRCPTQYCVLSFVIFDNLNDEIRRVYPYANYDPDIYSEAIPLKVREDLAEGEICLNAGAYKGATVLFRRAIQNIVIDKIKDPAIANKKLWEQIDLLFKEGLITKNLQEAAHEIRHFGNFGAYPSDDKLDKTSGEDANAIEQLTFDLTNLIYVTPYKTKQLQEKRSQSKKT